MDHTQSSASTTSPSIDQYQPPVGPLPAPALVFQPTQNRAAQSPFSSTPRTSPPSPGTPRPPALVSSPSVMPGAPASAQPGGTKMSQSLEDQNIFHLLGIQGASESEKESFLDELQQVIWEDFLENDVDLLITDSEMEEFKKIRGRKFQSDVEQQSALIDYLEKLIPDLEKIMLDKALELKEEMMFERVNELMQMYRDDAARLAKVKQAKQLMGESQWGAAADLLNTI